MSDPDAQMNVSTAFAGDNRRARRELRRLRSGLVALALPACVFVMVLVGAGPARGGTTNASTLTEMGTDAQTGSTASTAGKVGTTAAGDAINWVLHYGNTTGAPAAVNLTDPMGADQAFVPGSLNVPSGTGLSPQWSTNGGGSYVASEPGSGVNAVGATGTVAPGGLGATGSFSAVSAPTAGGGGGGDGWNDIFYAGDVYNLHHHYMTGESSAITLIDCHVVATGAECPGYDAGGLAGLDASSTAGTPFFSAAGQPTTSDFTTAAYNLTALDSSTGKLYFATTVEGTANFGVGCLNLSDNTSCGFTQLGTGPFPIASSLANAQGDTFAAGGATIGNDFYVVDFSGHIDCYDYITASTCGTYAAMPTQSATNPSLGMWTSIYAQVQSWDGRYLFATESSNLFPPRHYISCLNVQTGLTCPGYPMTANGTTRQALLPVLDASGAVTGVCAQHQTGGTAATMPCYDTSGNAITNPYPVPAGGSTSWAFDTQVTAIGSKVYWDLATGTFTTNGTPTSYQYQCYDFATAAPCVGFNSPVQNYTYNDTGDLRAYSIVPDPSLPGCLAEAGDGGIIQYFSAITGALGCTGSTARVVVNPANSYCDGLTGHVTSWNQIDITEITAAQYAGATYTVYDENGNPVPGFANISVAAGQQAIDISAIPITGATSRLSVAVTLADSQTGVSPRLSVTFAGDAAEVCFQTKVRPASCSVAQSITNHGNALTVGDNGVSDLPGGDDSGDATFIQPADPTLPGCAADLSILKRASPGTEVPGSDEAYTLVVKNNGPDGALNTSVADPLPTGLSFVSASSGCRFAGGKVICPVGRSPRARQRRTRSPPRSPVR